MHGLKKCKFIIGNKILLDLAYSLRYVSLTFIISGLSRITM
jgi:hypothetical protein